MTSYRSIRWLLAMSMPMMLITVGCSGNKIPQSHTKPTPPPLVSETPSFDPLKQPVSQPVESKLPFIITTDLTPLQQAIKTAVPEQITNAKHRSLGDSYFDFVRVGDPEVSIQDGLVAIRANYRGDNQTSTLTHACRPDQYQAVLNGTGQLSMVQMDNWLAFHFDPSHVTLDASGPVDSACTPSYLPAKEQLPEAFEVAAMQQDLAEAVSPEAFAIPVDRLWLDLNKPVSVPVSALNTHVCLYGQSSDLTLGRPRGTVQQTAIHGIARQLPTAVYESRCRTAEMGPMRVTSGHDQQTGQTSEQRPYKVLGSVPIPYAALNQELQNRLFHRSITLDSGRDPAIIERINASDANGRVLIAVDTSSGLDGTMYYWGTPQFHERGKAIRIPDLQMANESKRALDSMQMGYWQLVDRQLRERLRDAATIDLTTRVDRMKTALSGAHQSGDLKTDMLIAREQPDQVRTTRDGLVASYYFEGTATASERVALTNAAPSAISSTASPRDRYLNRQHETGGIVMPSNREMASPYERGETVPAQGGMGPNER